MDEKPLILEDYIMQGMENVPVDKVGAKCLFIPGCSQFSVLSLPAISVDRPGVPRRKQTSNQGIKRFEEKRKMKGELGNVDDYTHNERVIQCDQVFLHFSYRHALPATRWPTSPARSDVLNVHCVQLTASL